MQAGKLDRRLKLERFTPTTDSFGGVVKTWTTLLDVWASKTDLSDAERISSREVSAEISTRFRIRWSLMVSDLNPKDRCSCEGISYEIIGVKELSRREGLEISALARADRERTE